VAKSPSEQPQETEQLVNEELNNIYMTMPDVMAHFRVKSHNTITRWIEDNGFPKPTKFGGVVRWDVASVAKWAATHRGGYKPESE
jgi:predicted DNA-binding transcriptional regulator AlpA